MDGFAFMRADDQRAQLIDHIGACERILATPLAKVVSIKVRHFIFLYLALLPLAIVDKSGMLTPFLTMLIAFPLLALDQIGIELENPFSVLRLSHLPLTKSATRFSATSWRSSTAYDSMLEDEENDAQSCRCKGNERRWPVKERRNDWLRDD